MQKIFARLGPHQSTYAAERWLTERGISYAPSSARGPAAIMFGNWNIAKWHNLTSKQQRQVHGTLDTSRMGTARIFIRPEFEYCLPFKVISLWQPWASLIALGYKLNETRSYALKYRGRLAIHAALRKPTLADSRLYHRFGDLHGVELPPIADLPLGKVVCVGDLVRCWEMSPFSLLGQTPMELSAGNWAAGRFAWRLEDVQALPNPVPHKGQQNLHRLSPPVEEAINFQLGFAPGNRRLSRTAC
jgi:activating signal cointegrator 1